MKNKYLILVPFLFGTFVSFGQERASEEITHIKPKTQQLIYAPEIPSIDSYTIIVNNKNAVLSDEQLLEMNKYRRYDKSVEWKINEDLVVLLTPFKK